MKAEFHESMMEHYEKAYEGKKVIDISGEMVVPDKMPDIGLLGDNNIQVLLRSKHIENGRAWLDGELDCSVCYLPDGEQGISLLNLKLPWSCEFESDAIANDGTVVAVMGLLHRETRMLNPRKILVKIKLEVSAAVYGKKRIPVCFDLQGDETIQVRKNSLDCAYVSAVCEKTFAATDEYPLPASLIGGEVIGKSVQFRIDDIKTLTNKLVVKGCVISDVLVAASGDEVEKLSFTSGFSFIAETECENVSDVVRMNIAPTAMYYEVSSDGKTLSVEVHGVCQMTVYEKKSVRYLSDAYSNFYDCSCEYDVLTLQDDVNFCVHRENVSGSIPCRSQLASVRFLTTTYTLNETRENTRVALFIESCVKYENGTMDWVRKQVDVPLKMKSDEKVHAVRIMECHGSCNGTELEYRMTLEWESACDNQLSVQYLTSVTWDAEKPLECKRPSITVVQGNGDLWNLARKYGSTVRLIQTYNELDEVESVSGTMLLIPRQLK